MSEFRQDPTTKEWIIVASHRAKRPHDFINKQHEPDIPSYEAKCPFCSGNEYLSPNEIFRYPADGNSSWRVRVVTNKYPVLVLNGGTQHREESDFFNKMSGIGVHDVIIETPVHNRFIYLMTDDEVSELLAVYRERYRQLSTDARIKLIIIFKNHGKTAGTSLVHPHSQLVATPIVPAENNRQFEVAIDYRNDTGRCLYYDIIDHELKFKERVVIDTNEFIVFHPFASRVPFETWIMPKNGLASFGNISMPDLVNLAPVLKMTLQKLHIALANPDFNYAIHTAPVGDEDKDYYSWYIRIVPRLTSIAGFEIGSGMYINTALPEETAEFIRNT